MQKLTIVGIGPGNPKLLTLGAMEAMFEHNRIILRTARHGVANWLKQQEIEFSTLDHLYDTASDFDDLAHKAAKTIADLAADNTMCYAVPDVGDSTVSALIQMVGMQNISILPGVSVYSHLIPYVGADYNCSSAISFDKIIVDTRKPTIIYELDDVIKASEVKLKLMEHYPADYRVSVLMPSESDIKSAVEMPLYEMDRLTTYDHTCAVAIPSLPLTSLERYDFNHLVEIMDILRGDNGCSWDMEQDHVTLKQYLIEETYEVLDAIDKDDTEKLFDELGDVLLQVVFHAKVGKQHSEFDIMDVTTAICKKMISRHPHIFGSIIANTADDVLVNWEAIKKTEKGLKTQAEVMRDVPNNLPALMRAAKVQHKAASVGFDWDNPFDALNKVFEEADEVKEAIEAGNDIHIREEIGDLLFACVNVTRILKEQPELMLTAATNKFISRFEKMEAMIKADGQKLNDMTLVEMDAYWDKAKRK